MNHVTTRRRYDTTRFVARITKNGFRAVYHQHFLALVIIDTYNIYSFSKSSKTTYTCIRHTEAIAIKVSASFRRLDAHNHISKAPILNTPLSRLTQPLQSLSVLLRRPCPSSDCMICSSNRSCCLYPSVRPHLRKISCEYVAIEWTRSIRGRTTNFMAARMCIAAGLVAGYEWEPKLWNACGGIII